MDQSRALGTGRVWITFVALWPGTMTRRRAVPGEEPSGPTTCEDRVQDWAAAAALVSVVVMVSAAEALPLVSGPWTAAATNVPPGATWSGLATFSQTCR